MQKKVISTLIAILFLIPIAPVLFLPSSSVTTPGPEKSSMPDFEALAKTYGSEIPVVVRFSSPLSADVLSKLQSLGVHFSFGDPSQSSVGGLYLLRGDAESLSRLAEEGLFSYAAAQTSSGLLNSPRDVSIPEIGADDVWKTLDGLGRNITGKGVIIADLDTGVDWTHPDLWFADGGTYNWIDQNGDGKPTNGTDFIDLNRNGVGSANETLRFIDLGHDGVFNASIDWIWAENISQDGIPQIGEPFFVVNDANHNGKLDVGETLVMLSTPKTKYIAERDGTPARSIKVWVRGINLTVSTHEDTDGHGTAVSGILLGGQIGYRTYVGVAPGAELMMIKVLGATNTTFTIEEGLTWAVNHGADVILIEIGSWIYHYLDGSGSCSAAETMIDTITSGGIPVIVPSGNLGGTNKHAKFTTIGGNQHAVDFDVPGLPAPEYWNIWITVLCRDNTNFSQCSFVLVMNFAAWGIVGPPLQFPLTPGNGYKNFVVQGFAVDGGTLWVESFISTSARSTRMLGVHIWTTTKPIPTTAGVPPFHQLAITPPVTSTFQCFIADDQSSWSGGVTWMTDQSNEYEITWPSTADSAISVASYHTRNLLGGTIGDIASYSGIGPRIDSVIKQSIAAPGGMDIISDYTNASTWEAWFNANGVLSLNPAFGGYRLFSGTSAAGPHVAGCAALILQAKPSAGSQVSTIIEMSARVDAFTGAVPNEKWGFGKLNASAAVTYALTPPSIGVPHVKPSAPTSADIVTVNVTVTDASGVSKVTLRFYDGLKWTNMTMSLAGSFYIGTIPSLPADTNVTYRILANDTLNNWAVSPEYWYKVQSSTTNTTTTQPGPDIFRIAIFVGIIVVLVLIAAVLAMRRRSKRQPSASPISSGEERASGAPA